MFANTNRASIPAAVALVSLGLAVSACGSPGSTVDPNQNTTKDAGDHNACDPTVYPCGPYGYGQGSVIENLQLTGQRDDNMDRVVDSGDTIKPINLADYFQNKNYTVLFVGVAAEWCNPCKIEQPGLVQMYKDYQAAGGKVGFLEALIQSADGKPADMATVDRWATTYHIPFDMASDATVALGPYYNVAAFPMQMVITTKDMVIQWQMNGAPITELKSQIDAALGN